MDQERPRRERHVRCVEDCLASDPTAIVVAMVADCISRSIYLGDDFEQELGRATAKLRSAAPNAPLAGALTLGEIASIGDRYLEFLNKSFVVATLSAG